MSVVTNEYEYMLKHLGWSFTVSILASRLAKGGIVTWQEREVQEFVRAHAIALLAYWFPHNGEDT